MSSSLEHRQQFVERLKSACDLSPDVPPPHKGRQQFLANALGVAPEAVSKWFKAVAMPRPVKMKKLAEILGVEETWLAFGIAPEMDRRERKAHGRQVEGAVNLAMGLAMLAGINVGLPSDKDPRSAYVDFYATSEGTTHMIHVCLGREMTKDQYEFIIPKEYEEVNCIAVVPTARGRYDLLDLPGTFIERHRSRRAGGYTLTIDRGDSGKYVSGDVQWPRVKLFADRI